MSKGVLTELSTGWLIQQAKKQKKRLIIANIIAVFATLISVPIPLLMPLMVDEVLLNQPDKGIAFFNHLLPASLQQPASYIVLVLLMVYRHAYSEPGAKHLAEPTVHAGIEKHHLFHSSAASRQAGACEHERVRAAR